MASSVSANKRAKAAGRDIITTTQNISGSVGVVGDGATGNVIIHLHVNTEPGTRPATAPVVTKGSINESQAARLKELVGRWVEIHNQVKKRQLTHQTAWLKLNGRIEVATYRATPASKFEEQEAWVLKQISILCGMDSAPYKDDSDQADRIKVHSCLRHRLELLVREHMHHEAAHVAWQMVEIAEQVSMALEALDGSGVYATTGFAKRAAGPNHYHDGYDYLTDKGYMVGVCDSSMAIQLCEKADRERWLGSWNERIEGIKAHEEELAKAKSIIRESPGIVQSELRKQYPEVSSTTLYYAAKRGEIIRVKKGNSYTLSNSESKNK